MQYRELILALAFGSNVQAHMNLQNPAPLRAAFNPNSKEPNIDYSITSPLSGAAQVRIFICFSPFSIKNQYWLFPLSSPAKASSATSAPQVAPPFRLTPEVQVTTSQFRVVLLMAVAVAKPLSPRMPARLGRLCTYVFKKNFPLPFLDCLGWCEHASTPETCSHHPNYALPS